MKQLEALAARAVAEIRQVAGQRTIPLSLTLASVSHQLESCLP
jgi:hypothetical protein